MHGQVTKTKCCSFLAVFPQNEVPIETLGPAGMSIDSLHRDDTLPLAAAAAFNKKIKTTSGAPSRKKTKGKPRRRTANPKKAKKGHHSTKGESISDMEDEEEMGGSRSWLNKTKESQQNNHSISGGSSKALKKRKKNPKLDQSSGEEEDVDEEEGGGQQKDPEDDDEWEKLQESIQKHTKKKFDRLSTDSPLVHAPYFPDVSDVQLVLTWGLFSRVSIKSWDDFYKSKPF